MQRTEQNSPLGLEVQLHITEAVCPALSEPGKYHVILMNHILAYLLWFDFSVIFLNTIFGRSKSTSSIHVWVVCLPKQRRCGP